MKLSPPKQATYIIAVVLGALGALLELGIISSAPLGQYSSWLLIIGFALLAVACVVKDL